MKENQQREGKKIQLKPKKITEIPTGAHQGTGASLRGPSEETKRRKSHGCPEGGPVWVREVR